MLSFSERPLQDDLAEYELSIGPPSSALDQALLEPSLFDGRSGESLSSIGLESFGSLASIGDEDFLGEAWWASTCQPIEHQTQTCAAPDAPFGLALGLDLGINCAPQPTFHDLYLDLDPALDPAQSQSQVQVQSQSQAQPPMDCWIDFTGGSGGSPILSPSASVSTTTPSQTDPTPASSQSEAEVEAEPEAEVEAAAGAGVDQDLTPKKKKKKPNRSVKKSDDTKRDEFLERNRLAASRSRAKKKTHQKLLEDESSRLEFEQVQLRIILDELVCQKEYLKNILKDHLKM